MIILKIRNIETDVVGELSSKDYADLEKKLSFRPESYQFSTAYNSFYFTTDPVTGKKISHRKWSGWKNLCWKNKKRTYFMTGLLGLAVEFFKERGIEFKRQDLRVVPEKNMFLELSPNCEERDYQATAVAACVKATRGIVQAATGSGKSILACRLIKDLAVKPFLFFVTSKDLLEQAKDVFESMLLQDGKPIHVGQVGDGIVDIQDITILTVQTCCRALGIVWNKDSKFDDEDTDDDTDISARKNDILNLLKTAKGSICDECVTGDSILVTEDGRERIDSLSEKIGKKVLSFDGDTLVWKKITHFYKKGVQKTLKITLSNEMNIRCTGNHLIQTQRGWLPASDLRLDDRVLSYIHSINYLDIKSLEQYGEEEVFDITVEDTHCFFANGILVHNCQHWKAKTCQEVVKSLPSVYYSYAMSATPTREQGDDLMIQGCFGKFITRITASQLIRDGWLVRPTIKMIHIHQERSPLKNYQNIYSEFVSGSQYFNGIVANIANAYIKQGRTVLVLVKHIQHGEMLTKMIPGACFVHGSWSRGKRKERLDALRRKEISCVCASVVFDEGVDVRALDTVILAGSGASKVRAMQRIGRILRPYTGKTTATAIDFVIHQKFLEKHAKEREKMYRTEEEYIIEHLNA